MLPEEDEEPEASLVLEGPVWIMVGTLDQEVLDRGMRLSRTWAREAEADGGELATLRRTAPGDEVTDEVVASIARSVVEVSGRRV